MTAASSNRISIASSHFPAGFFCEQGLDDRTATESPSLAKKIQEYEATKAEQQKSQHYDTAQLRYKLNLNAKTDLEVARQALIKSKL